MDSSNFRKEENIGKNLELLLDAKDEDFDVTLNQLKAVRGSIYGGGFFFRNSHLVK